jgi:hypothetical protein
VPLNNRLPAAPVGKVKKLGGSGSPFKSSGGKRRKKVKTAKRKVARKKKVSAAGRRFAAKMKRARARKR